VALSEEYSLPYRLQGLLMLVALYSLPYRPKGLEVELRSKGLALSTPRKVPSSATRTGGFACEVGGTKAKNRSTRQWML